MVRIKINFLDTNADTFFVSIRMYKNFLEFIYILTSGGSIVEEVPVESEAVWNTSIERPTVPSTMDAIVVKADDVVVRE